MTDDLIISGLVLWLTLGIVACGVVEAVTAVDGLGLVIWFGGMVLALVVTAATAVWEIGADLLRR